jgi:hypothetical protein
MSYRAQKEVVGILPDIAMPEQDEIERDTDQALALDGER